MVFHLKNLSYMCVCSFAKPVLNQPCFVTPHFASSIVNKGFILLSHFCTRSRTGHVYHNNKQQQSTKTDLDTF